MNKNTIKTIQCQLCKEDFVILGDRRICLKCKRIHQNCLSLKEEFPREAHEIILSEMLDHFENTKREIPEVRWANVISAALYKCNHLWNGGEGRVSQNNNFQEVLEELTRIFLIIDDSYGKDEFWDALAKRVLDTGNKAHSGYGGNIRALFKNIRELHKANLNVCPTCGGSGEVKAKIGDTVHFREDGSFYKACPDCKPIYQRKIGDEHYPSPNERTGTQRTGRDTVRWQDYPNAMGSSKVFKLRPSTFDFPDRRTGDRRKRSNEIHSKTLTGSLKAMRPQE